MKITVMGFGKQGMRVVKRLETYAGTGSWYTVYCDKTYDPDLVPDISHFLMLDFEYEIGSWVPEMPVRYWLKENAVREYFSCILKDTHVLVLTLGAGGTMTLAAKEIASYVSKTFPEVVVYIVLTLPFRKETAFKTNDLTHKMIEYLESAEGIAYSVIENESVLAECDGEFLQAYDRSSEKMAELIFEVMNFQKEADEDVLAFLKGNGLVFYTEFDDDLISFAKTDLQNHSLPYTYRQKTALVDIAVSEDDFDMYTLSDIVDHMERLCEMDNYFIHWNGCKARTRQYHAKVLAAGKLKMEGLPVRSLHVLSGNRHY